jgi:predicted nucleotidyltransferase
MAESSEPTREHLLRRIKDAVLALDSSAEIVLYGSRARGDAGPDSDWDLVILIDGPANEPHRHAIRRSLYEIEWDTGEVITPIVHTRGEWTDPLLASTPFHQAVEREGVAV